MRPLEAPPRLAAQQTSFGAYLRDPTRPPPPGIEERRLRVYRELFYQSIEGLLANNFPVIRSLRGDDWWHALVRGFYRDHASHTPLFPEIGGEFLRYIEQRAERDAGDPPFLFELAHYEWVELALSLDEGDPADIACDLDGDLLDGVPVISPLAWPLAYRFPVHRIRVDFQPAEPLPAPTCLLLIRDSDFRIQFKEIDLAGFRLMQAISDNPSRLTGRAMLLALAGEAGSPDPDAFVEAGGRLLQQLRRRQAIIGTAR